MRCVSAIMNLLVKEDLILTIRTPFNVKKGIRECFVRIVSSLRSMAEGDT